MPATRTSRSDDLLWRRAGREPMRHGRWCRSKTKQGSRKVLESANGRQESSRGTYKLGEPGGKKALLAQYWPYSQHNNITQERSQKKSHNLYGTVKYCNWRLKPKYKFKVLTTGL